jgi:sulfur carrier protein ThiS
MNLKVRLFGTFQDLYPDYDRVEGLSIDIPLGTTVGELLELLGIKENTGVLVISEGRVMRKSDELVNNSEIRIMQPIYGG